MRTAVPGFSSLVQRNVALEAKQVKIRRGIELACAHNAKVCRDFGEEEKARVWEVSERTSGNGYSHPHPLLN